MRTPFTHSTVPPALLLALTATSSTATLMSSLALAQTLDASLQQRKSHSRRHLADGVSDKDRVAV